MKNLLKNWKVLAVGAGSLLAASGASAQYAGDYAGAVTALGTMEADVLAVGLAGIAVFVIVRGFSWAKGALS